MAPPPATSGAFFSLLGSFGAATGTATLPLPFGELCASSSITLGTIMTAPWSVQVPAGLALVGPFTLQAIMLTDPFGPTLATTNAVILAFVPSQPPIISSVSPSSAAVGQPITVTGANFNNAVTVRVNGVPVALSSSNADTIVFGYPPGVPCDAPLRVTNVNGQNATSVLNPTPVIQNAINASGPASGGATLILLGTGFAPGTTVTIGGAPMNLNTVMPTVLTGTTPPGSVGPATVVVTTPGGCSTTTLYTYQ